MSNQIQMTPVPLRLFASVAVVGIALLAGSTFWFHPDPSATIHERQLVPQHLLDRSSTKSSTEAPKGRTHWQGENSLNDLMTFVDPVLGLNNVDEGLFMVDGLEARMIAISGYKVRYADGSMSDPVFHSRPDGGDVFADPREDNPGGWIYVSNAEVTGDNGAVGGITFDKDGNVIDYKRLIGAGSGTVSNTANCNGGRFDGGGIGESYWITAEEDFGSINGKAWQVDPTGRRAPQAISIGASGGAYEAFAYRNTSSRLEAYLTEDLGEGALRRWRTSSANWNDPWNILAGTGTEDYLLLNPIIGSRGTFSWTTDLGRARNNANDNYPNSEGIEIVGNTLYFLSKVDYRLFELNLEAGTYRYSSTRSGLFQGQPDQLRNILRNQDGTSSGTSLYFSEDGGGVAGIFVRNEAGEYSALLEALFQPETTGLSITPDGKRMYFCFQNDGLLFELQRTDGQSFRATTMNLKVHPTEPAYTNAKRRFYRA